MRPVSARPMKGFMLGALLLGACGESPPREQGTPGWTSSTRTEPEVAETQRYGGTIVVAGRGDPVSMNSLVSTDFESAQHQIHVLFVTLVLPELEPPPGPSGPSSALSPSTSTRSATLPLPCRPSSSASSRVPAESWPITGR